MSIIVMVQSNHQSEFGWQSYRLLKKNSVKGKISVDEFSCALIKFQLQNPSTHLHDQDGPIRLSIGVSMTKLWSFEKIPSKKKFRWRIFLCIDKISTLESKYSFPRSRWSNPFINRSSHDKVIGFWKKIPSKGKFPSTDFLVRW